MKTKTLGKKPVLASKVDYRGSRMFTDGGELNAGSNRDALAMLAEVASQLANGADIVTDGEMNARETAAAKSAHRREMLQQVIADKTGETAATVGNELAGQINDTVTKIGFTRMLAQAGEVGQGQRPEVTVDDKNVVAAIMTGPTQAQLQVVRDKYIYPTEVDLTARLVIEGKQMNQSRDDLLQKKYLEGVEAITIQEDTMWKRGADRLIDNTGQGLTHVSSVITPGMLGVGVETVTGYGLPLDKVLVASKLWNIMAFDREFEALIDPVSRLEIIRTGRMGTIHGAQLVTDATRDPRLKILAPNEVYYASTPNFVGEYTDRGGVQSNPLTASETGVNGAGWHLVEYFSLALPNFKGLGRHRLA